MSGAVTPEKPRSGSIPWLIATLAAVALIVSYVETIHDAWCKYVGLFCSIPIKSIVVSASSGGSSGPFSKDEQCRPHFVPVTISPTTRYRVLDKTIGFEATNTIGRVGLDVKPPQLPEGDGPEVGWFRLPNKSPRAVEVTIFTRTGACEALRSIAGRFLATEQISLWPPNWGPTE